MTDRKSVDGPGPGFWLAAAAGLALSVLVALVVLDASGPGDRPLIALGRALVIAVPVSVGLWLWHSRPDDRFARLLVAAGCAWFLPTLAESGDELLHSIGRLGVWLVEPILIYVVLAFPSGRLPGSRERALVSISAGLVVLLFLPTALLTERYPQPVPYSSCTTCPDNAFMVLGSEPAFVDAWVRPVRDLLAVLVFAAMLVILADRYRRATQLMRLTLAPVLAVAIVRALAFVVYVPLRRAEAGAQLLDVLGWLYILCLPGIALAFLIGLLRARLFVGEALRRLALRLRHRPGPDELTEVLQDTMEDPSLELAYWVRGAPGGWVNAAGRPVDVPTRGSGRQLTEIRDGGRRVAALIHDVALDDQEEFVQAAGSLALASLENQLLSARVDASLRELSESRARIQAAADDERRRIERDLHDGAQQRLVALRIRLGLVDELMREDPTRGAALVRELGDEAEAALEEVRSLAGGVYPSLLSDRGLGEALQALSRQGSLLTRVEVDTIGRYPAEIESAVYFCCLEALQNASKHADGATSVAISLRERSGLRFEVRDDGAGFAPEGIRAGAGLTNMRDRLAAVGGTLTVDSKPWAGTRVIGSIPLP